MKRAGKIPQQEANRYQVEKYTECPRNSVVRIAPLAVHVANRDFYNRRPMPGSQRRNEAVQLTIQRNLLENVSPIRFKGRAKIVNVHSAQLGHQPVGAARRNTAQPEIIDPLLAPAADNVVTLGNFLQKNRYVGGVVLQVAVHGDNVLAARMVKASCQRGSLAEVAAKSYHRHTAIHRCDFAQQVKASVS